MFLFNRTVLFLCAVAYIWTEAAYGTSIVRQWIEPSRKVFVPMRASYEGNEQTLGGFMQLGVLAEPHQRLLQSLMQRSFDNNKKSYEMVKSAAGVFWYSLYQRAEEDGGHDVRDPMNAFHGDSSPSFSEWATPEQKERVQKLVADIVKHCYHPKENFVLDGYGFTVNPKTCTKTQKWHIDYHDDYSTVFVPIVNVTPENRLQYLVPSTLLLREDLAIAKADQNNINADYMIEKGESVTVRQVLGKKFSLMRMDFGTIHRGIANRSGYDRPMFFVAVSKNGRPSPALERT